jgi:urease accessory protein
MDATTELVVGIDDSGRSRLHRATCEVPLLFRTAEDERDALVLSWVNGAAGPLGGDHLRLRLVVEAGASVCVRSTGASMVHPGPSGAPSTFDVSIVLGHGATLDWWPEPTVSVRRSSHRATMQIDAHGTATARIVESVVRGRHDEPGGTLAVRQRLVVDGLPVLDHEVELGDGSLSGPGAHGNGRTVLSALTLGARFRPRTTVVVSADVVAATLALDDRPDGPTLVTASAADLRSLSDVFTEDPLV